MITFAYDGTLNGDWVAHYATRLAANEPDRRLRLLHVREEREASSAIERHLAAIGAECETLGVALEPEVHAAGGKSVAARLLELAQGGPDALLVCGTRARPRNLAFLEGTVSARLLQAGRSPVVAIRVVQPGILGQPGRVLLPLAGHPRGARHALPLLRRLGPDLVRIHVLLVREISRLRYRLLGAGAMERLLAGGLAFVARVEDELRAELRPHRVELDATVVVSDDAPREILLHAGKLKARLVCLGASERSLTERLVSGNPVERVLRRAPCDVAIYRSVE